MKITNNIYSIYNNIDAINITYYFIIWIICTMNILVKYEYIKF